MRRGVLIGSWWGVLCSLVVAIHGGCHFPRDWSGRWFQSGVPALLNINLTNIETKGECIENQGDKFIIEDKSDNCYRCVVIHEKHENVLQYKETYCDVRESLDQMCGQITGDASLFSMFRTNPAKGPVPCPFKGAPFTFTYSRGSGECGSPVSRVDSCTDESRLLLRYQACPDVHGTESTVEELVCLATWKDGSTKYLVGKLDHKMATSDEDRYRCFVYEQHHQHNRHQIYQVAQSGDATCNGLPSATEGSRTMRLTTIENQHSRCRFPTFVTDHHHWHTLDHSQSYTVLHKNTTLHITRKEGDQENRVVCYSEHHNSHHQVTIVAHTTSGCDSGYVCLRFYRRDGHVIELQQSTQIVQVPEEACNPTNFNPATSPFITLINNQSWICDCEVQSDSLNGANKDIKTVSNETNKVMFQILEEKIMADQKILEKDLGKLLNMCHEITKENKGLTTKQQELIDKQNDLIVSLQEENKRLWKRVSGISQRLDECEQYSKANTLEIHGIPEIENENLLQIVIDVGKALEAEIKEEMVDFCHRLKKQVNTQTSEIIVKFVRRYDKERMLAGWKIKSDFSTRHIGLTMDNPIYIN